MSVPPPRPASEPHLRACHCCGLVHRLGEVPRGRAARCTRCGTAFPRAAGHRRRNEWAAAVGLAALILYPPGILLPVVEISRYGQRNETSIWSGTLSLLGDGEWFVGLVVLVCSIVIPMLKLVGLLALTSRARFLGKQHRATTYRWLELLGRWGMVDVLLVALLVSFLKLGDLVEVTPGIGVVAFGACVALSLVATACLDPHALWESE